MIKFTEKEIQNYIWSMRGDFSQLLADPKEIESIAFLDDLSNVSANALIKNKLKTRLSKLYCKIKDIRLIGCEVPLEQNSNSTIRADFIAVFPGETGIGIIELKKSAQTERQAFTELLAYANHLNTLFPAMTRDDSIYILISPMETRIARDAVIQSLTFDNRNVIAFIPVFSNPNDISTLTLNLWVPKESELISYTNMIFGEANFSVCKLSWEYDPIRWDAEKGSSPPEYFIEQFNSLSSMAAQQLEESGIHGFTYCSQLWSELSEVLPFTNSLVLVGLNPYSAGITHYHSVEYGTSNSGLSRGECATPHISKLIPALGKDEVFESNSEVLVFLENFWNSQLFDIGKRAIDLATKNTDGRYIHVEYGFMSWDVYQRSLLEDVCCYNFSIRPTGLMRHLYGDILDLDYDYCKKFGLENHPIHGDMPYLGVDFMTSQLHFREFIQRMFYSEP
jgi:hypothetical protein